MLGPDRVTVHDDTLVVLAPEMDGWVVRKFRRLAIVFEGERYYVAERAPLALRTLKMVLNRGAEAPLETALELERKSYAWLRSTHDYEEGVKSFLEKRPPKYQGR